MTNGIQTYSLPICINFEVLITTVQGPVELEVESNYLISDHVRVNCAFAVLVFLRWTLFFRLCMGVSQIWSHGSDVLTKNKLWNPLWSLTVIMQGRAFCLYNSCIS